MRRCVILNGSNGERVSVKAEMICHCEAHSHSHCQCEGEMIQCVYIPAIQHFSFHLKITFLNVPLFVLKLNYFALSLAWGEQNHFK